MIKVWDVPILSDPLGQLILGAPVVHGAMTVFPLFLDGVIESDWVTLTEAGDSLRITEASEAGQVSVLTVTNAGDRPVLLLDGEELIGAKQNRVLNTTVLVGARSSLRIPVTCVEAGRWNWRSRDFVSGGTSLLASLRRTTATRVSSSLRGGRGHVSDQHEVWDGIACRIAGHKVESPTSAMHEVYARFAAELDRAREALSPRPGQAGALVFIAGAWAGLDLLASPGLFARAWDRLCSGYAADAIDAKPEDGLKLGPEDVLQAVRRAPAEAAPAVGVGCEYRLNGPVTGAALVHEGRLAHLMVFPAIQEN